MSGHLAVPGDPGLLAVPVAGVSQRTVGVEETCSGDRTGAEGDQRRPEPRDHYTVGRLEIASA
ncbi:hypothetical protein [Streptomyces rubiginosohelvolus]|uniref:hypothetical protein n=1 Tax=Streptomyces rubiginosohelvolus TaxID=67362 RepID=UPI0035DF5998